MTAYLPGHRVEVDLNGDNDWHPGTLRTLDRAERAAHAARYAGFGLPWTRAMNVDLDDGRVLTFIDPAQSDRIRLIAGRSYLRAVP